MKRVLLYILVVALAVFCSCEEKTPASDPEAPKPSEGVLSVMSFNVRYLIGDTGTNSWENRKIGIFEMLEDKKPMVMGVQEAYVSQVNDILEAMPQYKAYAIARDGASSENETCGVFYLKDSIALMNVGNFWLSESPSKVSMGWDAACTRICTWALFRIKTSGQKFYHFNTHLDHVGTTARREGLRLIWSKIEEINKDGFPVFITGDFNTGPEDAIFEGSPYASARDEAPVTDSENTYNAWGNSSKAMLIDFIFYKGMTPLTFETVTDGYAGVEYISDHYPIISTFGYQY